MRKRLIGPFAIMGSRDGRASQADSQTRKNRQTQEKPANLEKPANPKNTSGARAATPCPTSAAKTHPSNGWYVAFCLPKACDSAKTTSDTQATRTWYYRNTVRSYSSTAASGTCTKAVRKPHVCPKSNVEFWTAKLLRNHERDVRQHAELEADGWKVIVVLGMRTRQKDARRTIGTPLPRNRGRTERPA